MLTLKRLLILAALAAAVTAGATPAAAQNLPGLQPAAAADTQFIPDRAPIVDTMAGVPVDVGPTGEGGLSGLLSDLGSAPRVDWARMTDSFSNSGDPLGVRPRPVILGDVGDNASGRPLQDLSYLTVAPSGFVVMRSGLPAGDALRWQQATETSMSYVRPHRKVQMMLELHRDESAEDGAAAGGRGLQAHAQVLDGLDVQVDSRDLGGRSSSFGLITARPDNEKPHAGRMLALGFNLGLIPAALGDCDISVALVVGQSSNPGPFVSVLTNVAVPDAPGGETERQTDYQSRIVMNATGRPGPGMNFSGGFISDTSTPGGFVTGDVGGGGGGDSPTPITPTPPEPVPEPASLLLIGLGGAALAARRKMKRA